ncbi:alpha-mannosidase, partial [bacterium]
MRDTVGPMDVRRSGLPLALALLAGGASAQRPPTKRDLGQGNTLYVVPYSHLDTQWRWAYPQVIREYIPSTMRDNLALIAKYPHYTFNFSGSRRYEMMREYYPADYEQVRTAVKDGRWFPCGSSVDEGDANVPSGESLIRHVLYGNHWFRRELGVASEEFMLPDCFGFPYALPSILAHCGLKGFSTQKLTWGSSVGIPFKVGVWKGPDGKSVVAALDPGAYTGEVSEDLSQNTSWLARIRNTGLKSGAFVDYHYYGTGDRGGAPNESSVDWIERSIAGKGPISVVSARADEMFLNVTPAQRAKMPTYDGELLLTEHSAGSITSQAYMKRWNRKNEHLADAAERASVGAM